MWNDLIVIGEGERCFLSLVRVLPNEYAQSLQMLEFLHPLHHEDFEYVQHVLLIVLIHLRP